MALTLRVVAHAGSADTSPIYARFDGEGGMIGRAESARLVLPDPRRTVSRFHANVIFDDGNYYVEDMGSTNPAQLNGRALLAGQRLAIRAGDQLKIGDYTIAVEASDYERAPTLYMPLPSSNEEDEATALLSRPTIPGGELGARKVAGSDELWEAFQQGAKVKVELPNGLQPEMMKIIGAMFASSVSGLRRLLQLRAASKRQVDVDTTAIRPKNNNPLKFASDDTRAMLGLLKPPVHGFLPGPAAVEDAVDDLESHNLAMMAALRLAVERTLARFDPAELEKRLSSGGLLGALVPMSRKARLWELYLEQQRAIRKEAAEGFEEAFTRAFAEAYEKELERLRSKRAAA